MRNGRKELKKIIGNSCVAIFSYNRKKSYFVKLWRIDDANGVLLWELYKKCEELGAISYKIKCYTRQRPSFIAHFPLT
jgi:hypothetical protein